MATTTSNMGLTVPQIGDTSPGYVTSLANSMQALDTHDHSSGKGAQVTPAGLNINTALAFNGQAATSLRNVQFTSQGAILNTLADAGSAFVYNGNLYFSGPTGQPVQITSGAALVALAGAIGGDYATYGASIAYSHTTRVYTVNDESGTAAQINCGPIVSTGAISAGGALSGTTISGTTLTGTTSVTAPAASVSGTATIGTVSATTVTASTTLTASGTANLSGTTNASNIQLGTSGSVTGGGSSNVTSNTVTALSGGMVSDAYGYKTAGGVLWYMTPPNHGAVQTGAVFAMAYTGFSGVNIIHGTLYNGSYILVLKLPRNGAFTTSSIALPYYCDGSMSSTPTIQLIASQFSFSWDGTGLTATAGAPSAYAGTALPPAVSLSTSQTASWGTATLSVAYPTLGGGTYPSANATVPNMYALLVTNSNTSAKLHFGPVSTRCTPTTIDSGVPGF